MMAKERFWVSWVCLNLDCRPLSDPPDERILGWWVSGYNGDGDAILVAVVDAENPQDGVAAIHKEWPEQSIWAFRFFERKPAGWQPSERFPITREWSKQRFSAAGAAESGS